MECTKHYFINKINKLNKNQQNVFFQSNFSLNLSLRNTGIRDTNANIVRTVIEVHDQASLVDVNVCNVCPA